MLSSGATASDVKVANLRCEYQANPIGLDEPRPRLSWQLDADGARGVRQTAYRIVVSSAPGVDGDLWDSGKIASDQSIQITYAGKELRSGQECHWQVRIWDERDRPSEWSRPASWRPR